VIGKIEGSGPIRTSQPLRRASKSSSTSGSSFSSHLDESEGASAAQDTSGIGNVSGVLNLQEVDDALDRAAKGKLRAEDMLDILDEIHLALLDGSLSTGKLINLSQIASSRRQEVDDPHLAEILDEIDLRAQVELAKFTSLKT